MRFVYIVQAALSALLLCGCSSSSELPRLSSSGVVVAFGDSITYGTGAKPEESYPAVLERLTGHKVVNSGVPGEVTSEGLTRLPGVLEREKPDLILLCHGGNDLLQHLDQRQTADNLRAMIKLAKERNSAVILIAVPSPDLSFTPLPFYAEVAKEFQVPLEKKALAHVLGKRSLKSDLIHPNAAGYAKLAESLAGVMKKSGALPD